MARDRIIQTDEKLPVLQALPLAVQHLMAMFGATVLVPILTGLDPAVGLMTSGIGTILYLLMTRGKIPSYLGSSFAFIAPIIIVGGGPGGDNIPAALGGLVVAGLVYIVVAGIIKAFGTGWLYKLLPPAVVGAVVIVIGLGLSAVAVKMTLGANHKWSETSAPIAVVAEANPGAKKVADVAAGSTVEILAPGVGEQLPEGWTKVGLDRGRAGYVEDPGPGVEGSALGQTSGFNWRFLVVGAAALLAAIAFASFFKGFLATIPILLGIIVGYVVAIPLGLVGFGGVAAAKLVGLPELTFPVFDPNAILIIAPVALVVIVEHIGHLLVINEITGKDFNPMLPESLAGDGIATALSAAVGGTPSTTYAENIGVMAVTKVYAVQLFWYAGALAFIIGGFVPKVGAIISSIPEGVLGGVSLLLFGLIASSGLRMLVESGIDYGHSRNLILSSVILVVGIGMETGGFTIPVGQYTVPGMALATVLGIALNLILPAESKGIAAEPTAEFITSDPAAAAKDQAQG